MTTAQLPSISSTNNVTQMDVETETAQNKAIGLAELASNPPMYVYIVPSLALNTNDLLYVQVHSALAQPSITYHSLNGK